MKILKFGKVFLFKLALPNYFPNICVPQLPRISVPVTIYFFFSFMNTFCRGRSFASFLFQESDRKIGILLRCICYIYGFKISLRLKKLYCFSASDPDLLNPYPNPGIFCYIHIRIRIQAVAESRSGSRPRILLKKCLSKIKIGIFLSITVIYVFVNPYKRR